MLLIRLRVVNEAVQIFPKLASVGEIVSVDDRIGRGDGSEVRGASHVNGNGTR